VPANVRTDGVSPPERDELAWLGARPVPARPYYDQDWYSDEIEAIFKRSWIPGLAADVQGWTSPWAGVLQYWDCLRTSQDRLLRRDTKIMDFKSRPPCPAPWKAG